LQPFVFSGLLILWNLVLSNTISFSVLLVLSVILVAFACYKLFMERKNGHLVVDVAPVSATYDTDDDSKGLPAIDEGEAKLTEEEAAKARARALARAAGMRVSRGRGASGDVIENSSDGELHLPVLRSGSMFHRREAEGDGPDSDGDGDGDGDGEEGESPRQCGSTSIDLSETGAGKDRGIQVSPRRYSEHNRNRNGVGARAAVARASVTSDSDRSYVSVTLPAGKSNRHRNVAAADRNRAAASITSDELDSNSNLGASASASTTVAAVAGGRGVGGGGPRYLASSSSSSSSSSSAASSDSGSSLGAGYRADANVDAKTGATFAPAAAAPQQKSHLRGSQVSSSFFSGSSVSVSSFDSD
jgi:hypothetical protein